MKRVNPTNRQQRRMKVNRRLQTFQMASALIGRSEFASRMGMQYNGYRKIYDALGYPNQTDLTFQYYYEKYKRQDIATAVIDRPVDATWRGGLSLIEPRSSQKESTLATAWSKLDDRLKVKQTLVRGDKLAGIGRYAVLLLGFSDVKKSEDMARPVGGSKLDILYIRPCAESQITVTEWELRSNERRYGLPLVYELQLEKPGENTVGSLHTPTSASVKVHHTRILHLTDVRLLSEVEGRPRLEPIVNRLADLEKLLGGDAEMFWRGARPGYHAKPQPEYTFSDAELENLEDELDKFEHDLRRVLAAEGVEDFKALDQQVSDPSPHVDIQLQAISAQTGIPKRILVGSERGELSSSQDQDQWNTLITTRREEYAEPFILRPFVDVCMEHGILPKVENYNVMWDDLFAPSDKDKAGIGEIRARALKSYVDAVGAMEVMPLKLMFKHLLGLSEEEIEEAVSMADEAALEEEKLMSEAEKMAGERAAEQQRQQAMAIAGGNGQPQPPQRGSNGKPPNQQEQ